LATERLAEFRETVVPWLDSVRALSGLSKWAAEPVPRRSLWRNREALVTGVELEESPLVVARRRCEFGVEAQFLRANAVALNAVVDMSSYDLQQRHRPGCFCVLDETGCMAFVACNSPVRQGELPSAPPKLCSVVRVPLGVILKIVPLVVP
jgi:hypothetical protein